MRGSAVNINLLHLNANYSHSDLKRRGTSIFLRQRGGVHPMDPDLPLTKLWLSPPLFMEPRRAQIEAGPKSLH
jgi:hypothetical protein